MVIKKCITVTEAQDTKIRALQMKQMGLEKKNVSYSRIIQRAIDMGLEAMK